MGDRIKIGFVSTASPLLNIELAKKNISIMLKTLQSMKAKIVAIQDLVTSSKEARLAAEKLGRADLDLLVIFLSTFTEDPIISNLTERSIPTVLWAIPEPNLEERLGGEPESGSLVGLMMNASALAKADRRFKVVFGKPDDGKALEEIEKISRAIYAKKQLRKAKIGLVGYRAPGFYDATFDELLLKSRIGPEVIHIDLSELLAYMNKASDREAKKVLKEATRSCAETLMVDEETAMKEVKLYLALRALVENYELDAVAVKCWPELKFSSCFALSTLSNEGFPAGCEADVNGTVTMLLLQCLTGNPAYFADIFHIDEKENVIFTYHCGAAATALAADASRVKLMKHPMGEGMTVEFPLKPGRVTLARLGSLKGRYRMFVAGGEALKTEQIIRGNPLRIRLDTDVSEFLGKVTSQGIEHHYLLAYGDLRKELAEFCDQLGIELITA